MSSPSSTQANVARSVVFAGVAAVSAYLVYKFISAPRSVRPGINSPFSDETKESSEFVERFETESREIFVKKQVVIDALNIQPGQTVVDLGAGTGLFIESLAEKVGPSGRVYAVEPFPKFVKHLKERVSRMRPELQSRITILQNSELDVGGIPKGTVDFFLAIDTYHHLEYHSYTGRAIHAALKPTGKWVVLDFERIPGVSSEWVLGHVRANKETVTKEVESCGFVVEANLKEKVGLVENYLLIFKKEQF